MTNTDIARKIVDRMTEIIDREGYLPWAKPWSNEGAKVRVLDGETTVTVPVKFWSRSGKPYTGVNPLILELSGHTGEFITWNQAKTEGGKVKKGAKGWPVVYWNMVRKQTGDTDADGNPIVKTYPMLKYYTVFSLDDVEGLETKHHPDPVTYTLPKWHYEPVAGIDESSYHPAAESVVAGYLSRAKTLSLSRENHSDRAFYRPSTDDVVVPSVTQFKEIGEYYSTLFHELGHSTGHSSRLNRFSGEAANAAFGSEEYSKEELVAEITAASILSVLGLESGNSFRNSAAYVQSWAGHIKDDPMMFVSAAGKAEKAIDFILGTSVITPDPDNTPDPDGKPEPETDPVQEPETPAFPKREDLKDLAFSYKIGSAVGQASFTLDLLSAANAATMKVIVPMLDGIEDAETRKNAFFTVAALAYYDAAENPEKRPRFREMAELYREKTGETFPAPETDEKPAAPKTVTAACKRIMKGNSAEIHRGVHSLDGWTFVMDTAHAVYLRGSSLDLPPVPETLRDFSKSILGLLAKTEPEAKGEKLNLPTVKEVKTWMKLNKKGTPYDLGGVLVDPRFLVDMLEALPGCEAIRPDHYKKPILFKSGENRGILMQIRPNAAKSSETAA